MLNPIYRCHSEKKLKRSITTSDVRLENEECGEDQEGELKLLPRHGISSNMISTKSKKFEKEISKLVSLGWKARPFWNDIVQLISDQKNIALLCRNITTKLV